MPCEWSLVYRATRAVAGPIVDQQYHEWACVYVPPSAVSSSSSSSSMVRTMTLHVVGSNNTDRGIRPDEGSEHMMYHLHINGDASLVHTKRRLTESPLSLSSSGVASHVRRRQAAICVYGTTMMIVCGGQRLVPLPTTNLIYTNQSDHYLNCCEAYNHVTKRWSMLPSMKVARCGAHAVVINNHVHVMGGTSHDARYETSVEVLSRKSGNPPSAFPSVSPHWCAHARAPICLLIHHTCISRCWLADGIMVTAMYGGDRWCDHDG